MRYGLRLLLIALAQTALLAGMVGAKQWTLSIGRTVMLEVVPVDPRSLFSGDYVNLRYAISRLRPEALAGDDDFEAGMPVHVVMGRDGGAWTALSLHHRRPDVVTDQVMIRGQVSAAGPESLSIRYGIESFYLPEGEGRALEAMIRDARVQVEIVVADDGDAVLSELLIDGVAAYQGNLF